MESTLTDIRYLLPRECYFHYQVVPFCYMLTITVQNYFEEKKTYKAKGFFRKGANASPNAFSCFWFAIAPMPLYLTKKKSNSNFQSMSSVSASSECQFMLSGLKNLRISCNFMGKGWTIDPLLCHMPFFRPVVLKYLVALPSTHSHPSIHGAQVQNFMYLIEKY